MLIFSALQPDEKVRRASFNKHFADEKTEAGQGACPRAFS